LIESNDEIWVDIKDYEGIYQVSNLGRVKSLKRKLKNGHNSFYITKEKILTPYKNKKGYLVVCLSKNRKSCVREIHQLVFFSFNPIEKKKGYDINHKGGVKENNYLNNLEYITHQKNMEHASCCGLLSTDTKHLEIFNELRKIKILQFDKNNNFICSFESINEAIRLTGITGINKVFSNGKNPLFKTAGEFIWKKE